MAWFALSPFIHPLDCSQKYRDAVVPMNTNEALESIYNADVMPDGNRLRPYYFSKFRLEMHLNNADTYYYRSRPFAPARTGYGGYEKAHEKFDFAQEMGIIGKCQKSEGTCVMLLGIDVDAKNNEPDAAEVCQMLMELFPGSYYEPSTGGKGIHFYLKIFYSASLRRTRYQTIKHIHRVCIDLGAMLDKLRFNAGYQAPIDKVRSHPSLLAYDSNSNRIQVQTRTVCIKIPRFAEGEDDVLRFHGAPYVDFRYLEQLVRDAKENDLVGEPDQQNERDDKKLTDAYLLSSQDTDEAGVEMPGEGGGVDSNSVCTRPYAALIESLQTEQDAYERSVGFALGYARHLRRIPTVDEMLTEYEAQNLNTDTDDDGNRRRRMEVLYDYHLRTFDLKKLGFSLEGFETEKNIFLRVIQNRIAPDTELTYQQNRVRHIAVEDLAQLYFALCRSQGEGSNTAFSVKQARNAMLQMTGKKGSPHKISRMFGLLEEMSLIEQIGGYAPGIRGKVWRIRLPEQLAEAAAA